VHSDVHALLNAGILQKTETGLIVFPFDAGRDLFEGLAGVGENSGSPCFRLIASDNDIDVERIEFDAAAQARRAT
jgi:hypothetical protein